MDFGRQSLAHQAAVLAAQSVYGGASSCKYPGWCGTLYDRARYECGKFAETCHGRVSRQRDDRPDCGRAPGPPQRTGTHNDRSTVVDHLACPPRPLRQAHRE